MTDTASVMPFSKVVRAVFYSPYLPQLVAEKLINGSIQCYVSESNEDEDYFWLEATIAHSGVDCPRGWKVFVFQEDWRATESYQFIVAEWTEESIINAISQFLWVPTEWRK